MTTKQYLRFCPKEIFGVIASSSAKILPVDDSKNNLFAVPACENVILWNLQSKEKVKMLEGGKSYIVCLAVDHDHKKLAVGYGDGSIRIYDLKSGDCVMSFIGHKSAVSCLTFESSGSNLASGGKDTQIVIWDTIDQSGLFRLKGHKGPISKCHFYADKNVLISSSRDTFIKFWDLDTQHCFHTLVGCRHEVTDFVLIKRSRLIAGLNKGQLKVWDIQLDLTNSSESLTAKKAKIEKDSPEDSGVEDVEMSQEKGDTDHVKVGDKYHEIASNVKQVAVGDLGVPLDSAASVIVDSAERLLAFHGNKKCLYLYKILNDAELSKRFRKKKRKESKRKIEEDDNTDQEIALDLQDEFRKLKPIYCMAKIDSVSITVGESDISKITLLLRNNSIVQYVLELGDESHQLLKSITLPGHRGIIRALNYSSDNSSILSASDESVKVWKSYQDDYKCTSTMNCDSALCSVFVPGDSHCIIGTKKGKLVIFDIDSKEVLESVDGHDEAVQSITISPKQDGITTGSKDKNVKFWLFQLIRDESYSKERKRLSLAHTKTLTMPEAILCLKYSPDEKKLAISLLDCTIQVLFADSLKLAFSLYGYSLPVTCLDISYDSTLIVTGAEDKDIRIWSMEFGSCNKFLKKAHEKGITCIQFLPNSHLFFSGSRDGMLKQWDADNFQKILTLKGHQGEITSMTVSPNAITVVTASRDNSIRTWEKTAEPLVLQEEQEKDFEEQDERIEDLPVIPGEANKEVALSGLKTMETIKNADQLIEALKLYTEETAKFDNYKLECKMSEKEVPPPAMHQILLAYRVANPLEYMQKVVTRIKSSELEGTLLHLPFNYVLDLFKIISEFVDNGWETEFCEKCTTFLIRIHFGQILSARNFQPIIEKIKEKLFKNIYHMKDTIGYAKVVSNLQKCALDSREEVSIFNEALEKLQKRKRKAKRKFEHSIISFV